AIRATARRRAASTRRRSASANVREDLRSAITTRQVREEVISTLEMRNHSFQPRKGEPAPRRPGCQTRRRRPARRGSGRTVDPARSPPGRRALRRRGGARTPVDDPGAPRYRAPIMADVTLRTYVFLDS